MKNLKIFSWQGVAMSSLAVMSLMLLSFNKDSKAKNYIAKANQNEVVVHTLSQKVERRGNCPLTLIYGCSQNVVLVACEGQCIQQKKKVQNNF
jgi:hypothetical protein